MTKTYEKIREKIVDRFPELEEENKEEKLKCTYRYRLHMDDEDTLAEAVVSSYNIIRLHIGDLMRYLQTVYVETEDGEKLKTSQMRDTVKNLDGVIWVESFAGHKPVTIDLIKRYIDEWDEKTLLEVWEIIK